MVLWRFKKVLFKPDSRLPVTCQFCTYVAPRHTHDALCTAVELASRLERIPFMSCRSTAQKSMSPRNRSTSSSVCKAGALVPSPPCLGEGPHGWVPVDTHSTPVLTSVRRLWVAYVVFEPNTPQEHAQLAHVVNKTNHTCHPHCFRIFNNIGGGTPC